MNNFYIDKSLRFCYFYFFKHLSKIKCNLGLKKVFIFLVVEHYFSGPEIIRIFPLAINCNHKCLMCWQRSLSKKEVKNYLEEEKNSLAFGEYKKLLLNLPIKTKSIEVTGGGEPLLHPNIMQILSEIKKHNLSGLLITNGALLDRSKARQLLNMSWENIRVSLHAVCRSSYKKLHGRDDFELVCKNILFLRKLIKLQRKNTRLSLLFVIQKENYEDIENFSLLAEKMKVSSIEYDNLIPLVNKTLLGQKEMYKSIFLLEKVAKNCRITNNAWEQIRKFKKLYKFNKNNPINYVKLAKERFYNKKCRVAHESLLITAAGDVYPCCLLMSKDYKLGNIRNDTIHDIWYMPRYKNIREKLNNGNFFLDCYKSCSYFLVDKN